MCLDVIRGSGDRVKNKKKTTEKQGLLGFSFAFFPFDRKTLQLGREKEKKTPVLRVGEEKKKKTDHKTSLMDTVFNTMRYDRGAFIVFRLRKCFLNDGHP